MLYVTFRNLEIGDFFNQLYKLNFLWIVIATIFNILSHYIRGLRWTILLRERNVIFATISVFYGYTFNIIFPRAGEIARASFYSYESKHSFPYIFGTIIFERFLDLIIFIGTIIFLFLLFDITTLKKILTIDSFHNFFSNKGFFVLLFLFILGIVFMFFSNNFWNKIKKFLKEIKSGIMLFLSLKLSQKVIYILLTFGIWLCYFFSIFSGFQSFSELKILDIKTKYLTFVMGGLGITLPSQGGFGTFHFLVSKSLSITYPNIPQEQCVFFATTIHTLGILTIIGITITYLIFRKIKSLYDNS